MLDFHNEMVKEINVSHVDVDKEYHSDGRRAFVIFKIQIKRLLELIKQLNTDEYWSLNKVQQLDILYIVFYYGLDATWPTFIEEKLKVYSNHKEVVQKLLEKIKENPKLKLGRTNQTSLSAYFRNMYNAIKLIDDSKYLSGTEKKDLVKIYRAQLSNPELYVLFFNLMSRFGKKWKARNYVVNYAFIKNLPKGYCDEYEPSEYFEISYEADEL